MANLFGTLNRFISRLDSDPTAALQSGGNRAAASQNPSSISSNVYGFQILQNTNPSIPLDPWFDFIIGINGHNIDNPDPSLFITEVRNCAGSTISLGVYGAKGSSIREIYLTVPSAGEALEIALQWAPLSVAEDVWHILDVMPNSPADVAGLLPYSDYVIGSPEGLLHGDGGLGGLVEKFLNSPLRLYVYNQEYDVTRMVTITPAKNWGGEGALGCVLGYGALHRIPAPLSEGPTAGPGETLFSTDDNSNGNASFQPSNAGTPQPAAGGQFFVPANNMSSPAPPPSAGGGPPPAGGAPMGAGKPRKARGHQAPAAGLDDYFAEGEQKSRELEGTSSTPKAGGGLPPPPKAGGPPKASSPAPPADAEGEKAAEEEA